MSSEIRLVRIFAGLAILTARATAQTAPVKFEVASVKPCKSEPDGGRGKSGGGGGGVSWDPGMLHVGCMTLYNLVRDAYLAYPEGKPWAQSTREAYSPLARGRTNGGCTGCGRGVPPVSDRQFREHIKGAPGWVETERYSIEAKTEAPATPEMMRGPMMQQLLEERFKLKIHRETRDVPAYELRVAEGGAKLQRAPEGGCIVFDPLQRMPEKPSPDPFRGMCGGVMTKPDRSYFIGMTMAGFCRNLSFLLDRDVVDKTGLDGVFDIEVAAGRVVMPPDDTAPPMPDGMPPPPQTDQVATARAFRSALPKIGLTLEPVKAPGVFLVMDNIERPGGN